MIIGASAILILVVMVLAGGVRHHMADPVDWHLASQAIIL